MLTATLWLHFTSRLSTHQLASILISTTDINMIFSLQFTVGGKPCTNYHNLVLTPGTSLGISVVAEPVKGPTKQQQSIIGEHYKVIITKWITSSFVHIRATHVIYLQSHMASPYSLCRSIIACSISTTGEQGLEQFTAATSTATITVVMSIN